VRAELLAQGLQLPGRQQLRWRGSPPVGWQAPPPPRALVLLLLLAVLHAGCNGKGAKAVHAGDGDGMARHKQQRRALRAAQEGKPGRRLQLAAAAAARRRRLQQGEAGVQLRAGGRGGGLEHGVGQQEVLGGQAAGVGEVEEIVAVWVGMGGVVGRAAARGFAIVQEVLQDQGKRQGPGSGSCRRLARSWAGGRCVRGAVARARLAGAVVTSTGRVASSPP